MRLRRRPKIIFFVLSLILFAACSADYNEFSKDELKPCMYSSMRSSRSLLKEKETTFQTEKSKPAVKRITILAVGDIMCHSANLYSAYDREKKKYDFKPFFKYVKPYIEKADLAIGNLETVTAGEKLKYTSYPLFNTPDAILEALAQAGFDVLTTANNHCLDRGKEGLLRTIKRIKQNRMQSVGTSAINNNSFITLDIGGFKISILAYTYACNGNIKKLSKDERMYMVNLIDENRIQKDVEEAKKRKSDVIIACMHWGTEYNLEPNQYQKNLSDKLFMWGVDIIMGSHPHVIQKSEICEIEGQKKYVIYSMGNFLSNYRGTSTGKRQKSIYTEDGVMVEIELIKDLKDRKTYINRVKHIPTWVDKYQEEGETVFRILPIEDLSLKKSFVTKRNIKNLRDSYKRTRGRIADYQAN